MREVRGGGGTKPLPKETADAYVAALRAVRAALEAGNEMAARAARATLEGVDDRADLRRIAGVLAFLVVAVARRVRRGRALVTVLDELDTEVTWRAS